MRSFFSFGSILLIWIVLLLGVVIVSSIHDDRVKDRACARMWALARTPQDSIGVIKTCEVPEQSSTTVVPMPVYIPSSR